MNDIIMRLIVDNLSNIIETFIFIVVLSFSFLITSIVNRIKKYRKKNIFEIASKDIRIFEKIVTIRNLIDAQYVFFYQLHNGTNLASGISQLKVSLTHFTHNTHITQFQFPKYLIDSYPISFIPGLVKDLTTKDYSIIKIDDLDDDNLKVMYLANNIKKIINIRIGCSKYIYGFLQICFTDDVDNETINDNIYDIIHISQEIYLILLS